MENGDSGKHGAPARSRVALVFVLDIETVSSTAVPHMVHTVMGLMKNLYLAVSYIAQVLTSYKVFVSVKIILYI